MEQFIGYPRIRIGERRAFIGLLLTLQRRRRFSCGLWQSHDWQEQRGKAL
jgi:hypothetical protein